MRKLQALLPVMLENEDTISIRFVAWLGSRSTNAGQEAWIVGAMSEPGSYDYPVSEVMLIETDGSWFSSPETMPAKSNKPVYFGFLYFSTLAKRQHYCQEDLRQRVRQYRRLCAHLCGCDHSLLERSDYLKV